MSEFAAGQRVEATFPDDGTLIRGWLADVGGGALDLVFGGGTLAFTDATGKLRARWSTASIEILEEPRAPEPMGRAAVAVAAHASVTDRQVWVRWDNGRWRCLGWDVRAGWPELINPIIHFDGVPNG